MGKRALKGSLFSIAGVAAGQVLRLVSNLIVTRLLAPEAFGAMALVNTVQTGLIMMSDLGTRVSVIQNPRGDERDFLNTAWTVEILRGALIFLLGCAVAVPAAHFYAQESLVSLIPLSAAGLLILGCNSTKLYQQLRHIELRRNVEIDIASQVVGLIVQVAYAWVYRSVFALVVGPACGALTKVLLTHLWMPPKVRDVRKGVFIELVSNRLRWEPEAAHALIKTGRWIFLSSLLTFVAQRLDALILGKLLDPTALGVYGIAMVLALLPITVASPVMNQVLLPALADAHRLSHAALAERVDRARGVVMPAGLLAILGTAVFAPSFFLILYDVRYQGAGPITQGYMVLTWFQFLTEAFGRTLQAMDKAHTTALANLARVVVGSAGCYLGFQLGGLHAAIFGAALGALASYAVIFIANHRLGLSALATDLRYTALGLGLGLGDYYLSALLSEQTGLAYKWSALVAGLVSFVPLALVSGRRLLREVKAIKAEGYGRPAAS